MASEDTADAQLGKVLRELLRPRQIILEEGSRPEVGFRILSRIVLFMGWPEDQELVCVCSNCYGLFYGKANLWWKCLLRKLLRCAFLNEKVYGRCDLIDEEWEEWAWREYTCNGKNFDEWWSLARRMMAADRFGNPNNWDYCDWCGWWGWLETETDLVPPKYRLVEYEPDDGFHGPVYCLRCEGLKEPPWRPNNRDRFHELLLRNFQPHAFAEVDRTSICRLIAEYVAENRP